MASISNSTFPHRPPDSLDAPATADEQPLSQDQDCSIVVRGVSKSFKRYAKPTDRLKEFFLPRQSRAETFWALNNIDLAVPRGETLGIIGQNGSGKSTLLQIIAGTLTPTTGEVMTRGRVSALLELGSGFNPEFTGRQNVLFNGQVLGLDRPTIESKFDQIAAFAEIGKFIDEPVKTYSSGMFVRLAFAVAIHVEPEILIVDEALAVGDGIFVHRCMAKIKEFQAAGGTILFVSHDIGAVTRLCSEAIWINGGQMIERGAPAEICKHYQAWIYQQVNQQFQEQKVQAQKVQAQAGAIALDEASLGSHHHSVSPSPNRAVEIEVDNLTRGNVNAFTQSEFLAMKGSERFGTGRGEILAVRVLDHQGQPFQMAEPGMKLRVQVDLIRHDVVLHPHVGIALMDRLRTVLSGWSTDLLDSAFPQHWLKVSPEGRSRLEFEFEWPHLATGTYALDIAFGDGSHDNLEMLDWIQNAASVQAIAPEFVHGIFQANQRRVTVSQLFT
ncbi:MAG: ABC transporter ATP-binding protein [Synechococcales cyanobacterium RM1_1_8]|nr:ABC transporter ATP-binding protein [Synechococcales cyanobacterium RM1_1_8]